jgi:PTS system ascorbate-specific IIA component
MLHSAQRIINDCPLHTMCLEVPVDADLGRIARNIGELLEQLDRGDGVLVLTDMFGATPNNVARRFAEKGRIAVLAGLNLPMLVRVFNYPGSDLKELCTTAVSGGARGIQECRLPEPVT